ncbi:hypothetical protein [Chitinophaga pinensis]|uniref:Uncharacterized protein n=1 Tax=Chitinophaga pinensis TaxID=79329 RepID=A0A5C6LW74_9BACT|nr:hypothetical protein [Chitinophaga pinensis]TWW00848.1 hypothetical protein FEF09_10175 [Chitinophaga pinensis]
MADVRYKIHIDDHHSNFGIYLVKEMLGLDALELAGYLKETNIHEMLSYVKLNDRWQYSPDLKQLESIKDELTQ